jgi:hypothetical protein
VRRPGHAIGWLFVAMGLVAAVHSFAFEYAVRALVTAPGSLPAGSWLAWLAYWTFLLNLPALALLLLLFPDGRLPSRRWRAVPWLLGGGHCRHHRLDDAAAGPDRPQRGQDRQSGRGGRLG